MVGAFDGCKCLEDFAQPSAWRACAIAFDIDLGLDYRSAMERRGGLANSNGEEKNTVGQREDDR
jgi:hypothetical protein